MALDWVATELWALELGDARLHRRLHALVADLAAQPAASVAQACGGDWAATKAAYRLWDTPRVAPQAIRDAQQAAAAARCRDHAAVLVLHDTSLFDYRHHPATAGLGPLAHPAQQGFLLHSALAVSPAGVPLGLLQQTVWTREADETGKRRARRRRATADKESQRWLTALAASEAALPPHVRLITVADREADIFDLFAQPRRRGSDLPVRATHNRAVDHAAGYLHEAIAQAPILGRHTLEVGPRPEQEPRRATLTLQALPLALQPPRHHPRRAQLRPIPVTVVLAEEVDPPAGVTPLRWLLLTTLPAGTAGEAIAVLTHYSRRWLIERYHYVLKSGCRLERLQLQTRARLERALASYSLVAWRLLWLTYQARAEPEGACEAVLARHEWQALACAIQRGGAPPPAPPSLRQALRWIAQLGGFLGRRHDGEPGVKTLWQGWRRLEDLAAAWRLLHPDPTYG